MQTTQRILALTMALAALTSLGACSNMSTRDKNIAVGAGVGAVGGAGFFSGQGQGVNYLEITRTISRHLFE